MRFLKVFKLRSQKAQTEANYRIEKLDGSKSDAPEFLTSEYQAITELARFQVEARLVKQVPIDRSKPPRSWYGGKPQMPDYIAWPIAEGKPMVFVAQIDCSDFPMDLWGGVGPRSGWLLVFLSCDTETMARVIHTAELGPERNPPAAQEVTWLSSRIRKAWLDDAVLAFPKWPLRIYRKAADAPEQSIRFDSRKGSHDGGRPNPLGVRWPDGLAGNPLTPIGLKTLYDDLEKLLESQIKVAEKLLSDFTTLLEKDANPDEVEDQSAEMQEDRQHRRDRAARALPKLPAVGPTNTAAFAELRAVMERHPIEICPDLMSTQDWGLIMTELNQIKMAKVHWVTTRFSQASYMGEVYYDRTFDVVRPRTAIELEDQLTAIIHEISALEKKLKGAVSRRESLLKRHAALSPDEQAAISDRRRFELDHSVRTLETARSKHNTAQEAWKKILHLRYRVIDESAELVSDQLWGAVLEVVSGVVVPDFELEVLLPKISAREELEFETTTLLSFYSHASGGLNALETYRHIIATRLYVEGGDRLPTEVVAHFEPIWASAALDIHDGMGGVPRWDASDFRYFSPELFLPPEAQKPLRDEFANSPVSPFAPPPFDRDNALLLQLFSDPLLGWMWGDVSHLVLIVPRDDLAKARFDNVKAIVEG